MVVKYKHRKSSCDFELNLEVNHRKSVFFSCPKCNWVSEFIPITDYDETDSFKLNPFKIIDESLFEKAVKTKTRKTRNSKTTRNKVNKVEKLNTCKTVYSMNYKIIKQIQENKRKLKSDGKT